MPTAKSPGPDVSWSFDLSVKLKCAIADCITLYSKIESCIVEVLWILEQADLDRKIEIARAWGDQNFRMVKNAIKSIPEANTDAIWPALKDLSKLRNLIGHGVWIITDDDRPLVVWYAKLLESNDWVGVEYFDWQRFDHFIARGQVLINTFAEFKSMLEQEVKEEKRQESGSE